MLIDYVPECKVWKFIPKDDKKRKYRFALHSLVNNQEFHVDGATLKYLPNSY